MFFCPVRKISQVMMKRRCRASHLTDISVDLLCGTTAAELHNSVDLLCGTTAAETFQRWTFWKIQPTQIGRGPSSNSWNMYALRTQNKRPRQTFAWWTPGKHESPRELVRQSEATRKQAPQSEANVCRLRRRMQSPKKPPLLIAQDTQHKLGVAFS